MNPRIADELLDLSPAEKRELAEALIASAESENSAAAVTAQRAELQARLARHRAAPDERGVTFQELKARLLARSA